jgi:hypothetical protein
MNMPYFRPNADERMRVVGQCIAKLCALTGYSAYDPQLGRFVTAGDMGDATNIYRHMDSKLPELRAAAENAGKPISMPVESPA